MCVVDCACGIRSYGAKNIPSIFLDMNVDRKDKLAIDTYQCMCSSLIGKGMFHDGCQVAQKVVDLPNQVSAVSPSFLGKV